MAELHLRALTARVVDYSMKKRRLKVEVEVPPGNKDAWAIVDDIFPCASSIFSAVADKEEGRGAVMIQSHERVPPFHLHIGDSDNALEVKEADFVGPPTLRISPPKKDELAKTLLVFTIQAQPAKAELPIVQRWIGESVDLQITATTKQADLEEMIIRAKRSA